MAANINFFTPVSFSGDKSISQSFLENVDGYFSLNGKKAIVVSKLPLSNSYEVRLTSSNQSSFAQMIKTAFKIISYITLIIPIIMLIAKIILRSNFEFRNVEENSGLACFGDIHGEYDGFVRNLRHACVIDSTNQWSRNCKVDVIQMGDVVDRGPKSRECWQLLENLQKQAKENQRQFIRLLGNHELMRLKGNYCHANDSDPQGFAEKIKQDILEDRVQLSYFDGKRLFLHAGLRSEIRNTLINEIRGIVGRIFGTKVSGYQFAEHMNALLKRAVKTNDFSHPIFREGISRGGQYPIGGVLWEDLNEMQNSIHARDIPQIIAHNPPRGDQLIQMTKSLRLIDVDAGCCKVYGGNNAYIRLNGGKINIYQFHQYLSKWTKQIIDDTVSVSG
jgi:hypothetical protein